MACGFCLNKAVTLSHNSFLLSTAHPEDKALHIMVLNCYVLCFPHLLCSPVIQSQHLVSGYLKKQQHSFS